MRLVVGGDCNSRVINPGDQKSFPLFGDGAGAVLLGPGESDQGLVAYQLGSDGSGGDLLSRPACGSRIPPSAAALEQGLHYLTMDGRAVFKWAVRILPIPPSPCWPMPRARFATSAGSSPTRPTSGSSTPRATCWAFPAMPYSRTSRRYGNTSAGSIPIALDELYQQGGIRRGDLLLTSGFGAGLNWGTALWRW